MFRALPPVFPVLLLALVVGGSAPAQALQQDTKAYQPLVGSWAGVLEYLDYGDDRTLVQLPTHLVSKPTGDGAGILFAFSYQEPDGRVVTSTERLIPSSDGIYFGELWQIEEQVHDGKTGDLRLVLSRQGEDNNKQATIRGTVVMEGDDLTITQEVRYLGSTEWLRRHQYRLERAGPTRPDPEALVGTWRVDLRPTPDAEAYYREFVVRRVDGETFEGSFYGTELQHGRVNTDWGSLHFAFATSDGSGVYNTSGVLDGDKLRGTTHSLGREFLAVWTAERVQ